jgi:hypothetical protein
VGGVGLGVAGLWLFFSEQAVYEQLSVQCAGACDPAIWSADRARQQLGLGLSITALALVATAGLWWLLR